jgi:LPS-assembly protein
MMQRASFSPFNLSPVSRAVFWLMSAAALGMGLGTPALAQIKIEPPIDAPLLVPPVAPEAPVEVRVPVLPDASSISQTAPDAIVDEASIKLKRTAALAEVPPTGDINKPPTFVFGNSITGRPNLEMVVDGDAEIRRGVSAIRADRIEMYQPDDMFDARGNVRVSNKGNQYRGPELRLKVDTFEGYFLQPTYRFITNGGNGTAARIDFINEKSLVARNATFTTCERTDEKTWAPAWIITGTSFKFDQEAETAQATGAVLRFKGVPILAFPTLSFPLSEKRKSGLLPATYNVDTVSGSVVELPYYLNIAPNRDATLTPAVMSKRGLSLFGEYRYLERDYSGRLRTNYMPNDKLRGIDRWSYSLQHTGLVRTGVPALGNLGLNLNLNRVSDNNYWQDFPRTNTTLTQRLLANTAGLTWGRGFWSVGLSALKWQTLQDPLSPIVPPYDRLPQLTAAYTRLNAPVAGQSGFDWSVSGDLTRFSSNRSLTLQPNSDRAVARAQISRPWISPGWYITPKMQLHATSYQFDAPLVNGAVSASRVVPTFSLDSGLQFERKANYLGRDFTQTLEPRAFYVRTPFRDQSTLPNYDSGVNDFNFATVFNENSFVGNDRISDANLLTLGLTSRLLNSESGAEAVRFGVAQRIRFSNQQVTLPGGLPITDRISDVLFGTSINWTPQWAVDSTVQYNPKLKVSERSSFGARYNPGHYRVISAAIRRQRGISSSADIGWQWPINDLWGDKGLDLGPGRGLGDGRFYGVGRLNYSFQDKKLVDAIVGVEYDGCCWIGRVVLQRSQNTTLVAVTRILFQLELVGFSRLGVNPLQLLKTNIPRYQFLRDQVTPPSRFTNYD